MTIVARAPRRHAATARSLARLGIATLALASSTIAMAAAPLSSFPGARGYGRVAQGGRGGRIIAVTTLADAGPGSLRACIDALGPRVCVFRVAGVIRYTTLRPVVRNPFLTIAGETAPGEGILLTHAGGRDALTPLVIKDTHDVVVRDLRVRLDRRGQVRGSNSAVTIENSRRVMLDHISTSWSLDENVGLQGQNDQISITHSILAEGVPDHSKCALLSSDPAGPQRLSFIGNLCISNGDRNPNVNFRPGSCVEVINNILYNAKVEFAEIWESQGGTPVSIVGNYFRAGPNTSVAAHALVRQTIGSKGMSRVYARDNVFDGVTPSTHDFAALLVDRPPCPLTMRPGTGAQAYSSVLGDAGARPRDAVYRRLLTEVRQRGGHIVKDVGRLPPLATAPAYLDSDGDGMADEWERRHGLDPRADDAWKRAAGSQWTNLDLFLGYAHAQRAAGKPIR